MYIVRNNACEKLSTKKFTDYEFKERDNLQEWIAKEPNMLGEDLLIIQKEFAGFDKTKERLDLLALDKNSNLVIIENKLDNSGKDVVWQSLKYASYCSTLSNDNIIEIYQKMIIFHKVFSEPMEKFK
jgi:RecB family endonuclease NucS